jgi:hypothetical protein
MEKGDFANAAELFERLAQSAYDRGMLRQAPGLYLQTGRAYALAGNLEKGADFLRQGLQIIADGQHWHHLRQAGQRVVAELNQWNQPELAQEFESWLQNMLPEQISTPNAVTPRGKLPLKCPSCGGPVRPDEVEWLDQHTGECPYCGSAIRAEN